MKKRLQHSQLVVAVLAAILAMPIFCFSIHAQIIPATNDNTNQATATPTPPPAPTPIPLADLISQAQAASKKLEEIQSGNSLSPGIQVIETELSKLKSQLDSRTTETTQLLAARPSLETLRKTEQAWQSLAEKIPTWKRNLKAQIGVFDQQLAELKTLDELWRKSLDALVKSQIPAQSNSEISPNANALPESNSAIQAENAATIPPEVLQKVNEVVASINQTQTQIEENRAHLLTLQSRVSEQETRINDTLAAITDVREEALTHLFVQDSPAIWNVRRGSDSAAGLVQETENSFATQAADLSEYAARQSDRFILHGIILILLVGGLFWARRRVRPFVEKEPELEQAVTIFKLPVITALILTILLSGWLYPQAPRLLSSLLGAAALIPVVVLLRRLLEKPLFPILNALVIFYFVDRLREITAALPTVSRVLFIAEMAGAIIFLVWFLRSKRLASKVEAGHFRVFAAIKKAIPFALVIFCAALLANVFGYVSLAGIIGKGILGSAYIALILYTAVQIIESLLIFAFRVRPFASLQMVREHRPLIRAKIFSLLKWLAIAGWIVLTLNLLSVRDTVFSYFQDIFAAKLAVGSLSLSLGDVALFALTVWLAFAISRFVQFVLKEDVYPRVNLAGGVPYAISTMLHYVILVVGFVMAIAALGFDLTKFTILAGAFGVGLGFGLQTIVNNFVSGLILLFERPVTVGDTVQIGEHQGDLNGIGLRASILRKVDGSEVIVPNSKLISEEVINWTLSDQQRRLDVSVGVAYGSDPEHIIELLTKVALKHDNILKSPAPRTLFIGFGENSLDFQLRAWTDHTDQWFVIKSELAVGVHKALSDAGIEIPFPQRDLNLKIVSPEAAEIIKSGILKQNASNDENNN
ncbi:MAG: mechanosensitive ion channel domain-containing protein [Pyrinomonadaceae bacterium]